MTVNQTEALMMLTLLVGILVGLVIGWLKWGWLLAKKKSVKGLKVVDRERQQLLDTQKNIFGRISNALSEGLRNNLQWGSRLSVHAGIRYEEGPASIIVFGGNINFRPGSFVTDISVVCDFKRSLVRVAVIGKQVLFTKDPNDPQLTLLIGSQLDLIQKWTPTIS